MIDLNRLSIREFYFHSRRESIENASPRQVIDALRTVYWYCGVRNATGATTPYSLGKKLDPNSYKRRDDGSTLFHHNKWAGYARGAHVPGSELRGRVDSLHAGSAAEIQHPLWRLLAKPGQPEKNIRTYRQQLHPKTQLILQGRGAEVDKHIRSTGRALKKLDFLEALAGISLALERAVAFQAMGAAEAWRSELMDALLVHSYHLKQRGIAQPIFDFVDQIYSPRSSSSRLRATFQVGTFVDAAEYLEHALWNIEGVSMASADEKSRRRLAQDVIRGRYGWDMFFRLRTIFQ
ncbi:hypothetical protein [Acidovorax sp. Q11]